MQPKSASQFVANPKKNRTVECQADGVLLRKKPTEKLPPNQKPLTPKERLFVREYLVDLNASAAYRRAGFVGKMANVSSCQLLTKPNIQAAVTIEIKEREKRTEITGDMVIKELALLAFQNTQQLFDEEGRLIPIHSLPEAVAKTISAVEHESGTGQTTKVKLWDKKGALDSLGKYFKLFTDKVENTGKDGEPLFGNINIVLGKK